MDMLRYPRVAVAAALTAGICLCSVSGATAAFARQPAATSRQTTLDTVSFRSTQRGWLGGAHTILATTNGGRTWVRQYSGTTTIQQFSFVSDGTGWAMGHGQLLHTTDGGTTWKVIPKPPNALQQIVFVTATQGWAITGNPLKQTALYHTSNGGLSWTRRSLAMSVGAVCFSDPTHGLAARAFSRGKTAVTLLATSDGGTLWHPVAVPPGAGGINGFEAQSLSCPTLKSIWDVVAFGGYAGGVAYALYHSADGGGHWQTIAQVMAPGNATAPKGPGTAPGALDAPSAQAAYLVGNCFACGGQGTTSVGMTGDGGKHWRNVTISSLPATGPTALSFPTASDGWLVANWQTGASQTQSAVFQTTDGGTIWQRKAPAPQGTVQVMFTLSLYGTVPAGQQFAIAGPRALGGGSGAIPICTTITARAKLGLVTCQGHRTVHTRTIQVPRGTSFHFYFERFTH